MFDLTWRLSKDFLDTIESIFKGRGKTLEIYGYSEWHHVHQNNGAIDKQGQQRTCHILGNDYFFPTVWPHLSLRNQACGHFLEADIIPTWNRLNGEKRLPDTVFWQEETTGLEPGVTSQPTKWFSAVTGNDLNLIISTTWALLSNYLSSEYKRLLQAVGMHLFRTFTQRGNFMAYVVCCGTYNHQ